MMKINTFKSTSLNTFAESKSTKQTQFPRNSTDQKNYVSPSQHLQIEDCTQIYLCSMKREGKKRAN